MKTPPNNIEMERAVLGAILLDNEALGAALETLAGVEDFYKPAHRKIYECALALFEKGEPVDALTLGEELRKRGWLQEIGGVDYLGDVMDSTPTAASVRAHARVVAEKATPRRMITVAGQAVALASEAEGDAAEVVDRIEGMILAESQRRARGVARPLAQTLAPAMRLVEELYSNKRLVTGVGTGYRDLDSLTSGLQKSDLVVIAGRPSMGKTAFALNVAQNHTRENQGAVALIFSLEMSAQQLTLRLLTCEARVSSGKLRTGFLAKSDWPELAMAAGRLHELQIYIDDTAGATVMEMRGKARRLQAEKGRLDLVVVDYLQLMSSPGKTESRVQEISTITRQLKGLAKELNCPVIAVSQLSRKTEERQGAARRPVLSDLRESGSIEQDADLVLFVYREEYYQRDNPNVQGMAEIIIGKQRNGPLGTVKLAFLKDYTRFEDMANHPHPSSPVQGEAHGGAA